MFVSHETRELVGCEQAQQKSKQRLIFDCNDEGCLPASGCKGVESIVQASHVLLVVAQELELKSEVRHSG
jgi:hypothetical protein